MRNRLATNLFIEFTFLLERSSLPFCNGIELIIAMLHIVHECEIVNDGFYYLCLRCKSECLVSFAYFRYRHCCTVAMARVKVNTGPTRVDNTGLIQRANTSPIIQANTRVMLLDNIEMTTPVNIEEVRDFKCLELLFRHVSINTYLSKTDDNMEFSQLNDTCFGRIKSFLPLSLYIIPIIR